MRTALLSAAALVLACTKQPAVAATARVDSSKPVATCDSLACADRGRIEGSPNAKVWLVMASDFECPYCKMFHDDAYKQVVANYVNTGDLRVAFLNHPGSMHRHAQIAAEAAMCAAMQNKFWPMHDSLFARQEKWAALDSPLPVFEQLATGMGIEMNDWRVCVQTHKTLPLIDSDNVRTTKAGVNGTPMFFVADKLAIQGVAPYSQFKLVLDSALARAGKPGTTGN